MGYSHHHIKYSCDSLWFRGFTLVFIISWLYYCNSTLYQFSTAGIINCKLSLTVLVLHFLHNNRVRFRLFSSFYLPDGVGQSYTFVWAWGVGKPLIWTEIVAVYMNAQIAGAFVYAPREQHSDIFHSLVFGKHHQRSFFLLIPVLCSSREYSSVTHHWKVNLRRLNLYGT